MRRLFDLGAAMDYYGGFSPMAGYGRELAGAAGTMIEWAEEIETEETCKLEEKGQQHD